MQLTIESIEVLLWIAALVAMLSQRVWLPYTIGLVAAGILVGNFGFPTAYTDKGRAFMMGFWEFTAFIANSIISFVIGVREANQSFWNAIGMVAITVLVVPLGGLRAFTLSACFFISPD